MKYKEAFIGGAAGIAISFATMFMMAHYYKTTPVALINSNPQWRGWNHRNAACVQPSFRHTFLFGNHRSFGGNRNRQNDIRRLG